jgi:hypothetical protein
MRIIDRFIPFILDVVLFQDRNYRYIGKMIWCGIVLFIIIFLLTSCTKDPHATECNCQWITADGHMTPSIQVDGKRYTPCTPPHYRVFQFFGVECIEVN